MFGIGGTELLVILVVALIVLGPKSVPQIARTLGKAMGEFRKVSTEFQRTLNTEIELEEHEKRKQEAEKELFGTEQKATAATKPAEAASPAAKLRASPVRRSRTKPPLNPRPWLKKTPSNRFLRLRKPLPGIRKRRPPPMPTLRRGCPKSPRARRRLGRKRKHCPRPPLAVSLRPPSILLPGRKKSRKKNGP